MEKDNKTKNNQYLSAQIFINALHEFEKLIRDAFIITINNKEKHSQTKGENDG